MSIPGLDLCPVVDESGDGIQVPTFNNEYTVIPNSHMHGTCRTQAEFEKLQKISEGAFSTVYKCLDKRTNALVLLKKLKMPDLHEGIPSSILREMNILNSLKHVNVLTSRGAVSSTKMESNYIILDYCAYSLDDLLEKNVDAIFDKSVMKCIMKQLLEGLGYIHGGLIVHRNITAQNILFHEAGIVKITGFQTARFMGKRNMTPGITQLEYRAPELLFGAKKYESSADMWSAACVFAKFLLKKFLFSGNSELEVLTSIFDVLGAPCESIWPGFDELLSSFQNGSFTLNVEKPYSDVKRFFVGHPASVKEMIADLLLYCPSGRLTALECLASFYFTECPKVDQLLQTTPKSALNR